MNYILYFTGDIYPMTNTFLEAILLVVLILFVWVCRSDPGFVEKDKKPFDWENALDNLQNKKIQFDANRVCHTCDIVMPIRSKHCDVCNRCVYKFDYHYPWIGNCVGQHNHPAFLCYLFVQEILHIMVVITLYISLDIDSESDKHEYLSFLHTNIFPIMCFILNFLGFFYTGNVLIPNLILISQNETTNQILNFEEYPYLKKSAIGEDGRKTYEYVNPFFVGYVKNWKQFCFGDKGQYEKFAYMV